jgi:hypothetical protein
MNQRRTSSLLHFVFSNAVMLMVLAWLMAPGFAAAAGDTGTVRTYRAPAGEELSKDYTVIVQGRDVPVYVARVGPADEQRRWKAMDDAINSADYFDKASFASFDMQGPVAVTIACPETVRSVKVLPTSYGLAPQIEGKVLSFMLAQPRQVTIEVNGNWVGSLHLFANPMEVAVPQADDPNIIYFAPGIHELREGLIVGDGKTVYLAGGAVLRGVDRGGPVVSLMGKNITLRGRGIIDGGLSPTHSRHLLFVRVSDITVEGVILRDSSTWTLPIRQSDRVTVKNVKVLGYRANSDGIDICNSRDVTVEGCFLRTLDDLIVVKSDRGQGEVRHIVATNCVLWNQVAHALSVGAELRENVDDVLFTDCDVIHDTGREWSLRIYHCDSATISNVRFENIRIEESRKLISLWINAAIWSRDQERGHIKGVTFKNIRATSPPPVRIELQGFDATHGIEGVTFQKVQVNGVPMQPRDVKSNAFVKGVKVEPAATTQP